MLTFSHAGRFGDVLYSLYFATHYAHGQPFDFILKTGVADRFDPSQRPHLMEPEDAEFIRPLLEAQPYINTVEIESANRTSREVYVLDSFRQDMRRIIGKEIRTWYYHFRETIPDGEFDRPVLTLHETPKKFERIAICFTPRYRQEFDLSPLKQYQDRLVFIGLPDEWRSFCSIWFSVDYKPVKDALEMLRFMRSCRCFVGNVSGTFAIAECAKVPRILCLEPNRGNVRVYNNGFEVSNSSELEASLKHYMGELS